MTTVERRHLKIDVQYCNISTWSTTLTFHLGNYPMTIGDIVLFWHCHLLLYSQVMNSHGKKGVALLISGKKRRIILFAKQKRNEPESRKWYQNEIKDMSRLAKGGSSLNLEIWRLTLEKWCSIRRCWGSQWRSGGFEELWSSSWRSGGLPSRRLGRSPWCDGGSHWRCGAHPEERRLSLGIRGSPWRCVSSLGSCRQTGSLVNMHAGQQAGMWD